MRIVKRILITVLAIPILLYLLLYLLFWSIPQMDPYDFPYRNEPIESVELLYYPWYEDHDQEFMEFKIIRELAPEEIPMFMESLYGLKTVHVLGSPPSNYGAYIARVVYDNQDAEYFGSQHFEIVEAGTEAYAVGIYAFAGDNFEKLFLEYAGNVDHLK